MMCIQRSISKKICGGVLLSIMLSSIILLFSCADTDGGSADKGGTDTDGGSNGNNGSNDGTVTVQTPDPSTAMAVGGIVDFIDNGDDTWDELHTFVYDSTQDTGGQTIEDLTFNTTPNLSARILVVAGGGAGGWSDDAGATHPSGGGGAGGLIDKTGVSLAGTTSFEVKVGRGGNPGTGKQSSEESENGKDSAFLTEIAVGGGGGGGHAASYSSAGHTGGSGGGRNQHNNAAYGQGTQGQGHNGGAATTSGGGGAGAAGGGTAPGNGGDGLLIDITGKGVWYAGGGSSGVATAVGGRGGGGSSGVSTAKGGQGGGGNPGQVGVNGTGGGGGGASNGSNTIRGGDGIVIIRFPWTAP